MTVSNVSRVSQSHPVSEPMNFYPFHIGDYLSHTRHLTVLEDVAYRRMLDVYYTHEKPLTGTVASIARLIGMTEYESSVASVLAEFFEDRSGVFHNSRADSEIATYQSKVSMRVKAGRASAKARRSQGTHVQHVSNVCSTSDEHTGNGTGTLSLSSPSVQGEVQEREPRKKKVGLSWDVPCPEDVDPELWNEWLGVRKAKRLSPPTERAITKIRHDAEDRGMSLYAALQHCCERGHGGFYPDDDNKRGKR